MPLPRKMEARPGALRVDTKFRVAFASRPEARLERGARRMIAQLSRQTGLPLETAFATASSAALVIDCREAADRPDTLGQDESYRLEVTPAGARLRSETVVGALHGLQTFLQLIVPGGDAWVAPAIDIEDAPRFPWRGLLIDVTSHFMPIPVIERNLDAMEAVKLNVFHWHFTDDQGFRVESKLYPKRHQLGTTGGEYYTQAEIRHILAYAHDRGIRILPEFDMPGHCATWLIGYPELASAPGPYSIIRTFGVYDPALDPSKEEVYRFIDGLIGEMAALFPDHYFHIGGDEVNGKHWKANPAIQAFIRRHGLKDEAGLQAYFNQRVETLVQKHGKRMMGWDEVLHPDLPKDIMIESWRDHESMAAAARSGHPALLSWGYYLDHLDSAGTHYDVDPLGGPARDLTPEQASRVLGGEACMWTEFISPETIDSRIWPKTAAIAERLWSPAGASNRTAMYQRLDRISGWLDWRGVRHNSNYRAMLQRLAPDTPIDALRTLGDAVEPLGIEGREITQVYSQETPLNRLVDTARAESAPVRHFEQQVERFVAAPDPGNAKAIRERLETWRDNHARFESALASSFLLKEDVLLSQDLSRLGTIGIEALDALRSGRPLAPGTANQRLETLKQMEKPRAEVTLVAVRPVRLLLQAAIRTNR